MDLAKGNVFDFKGKNLAAQCFGNTGFSTVFPALGNSRDRFSSLEPRIWAISPGFHNFCGKRCEQGHRMHNKLLIPQGKTFLTAF
jgi:hypothetical protein